RPAASRKAPPATDAGQPTARPIAPSAAKTEARARGRTSTTPCRRASKNTWSPLTPCTGMRASTGTNRNLGLGSTARRTAVTTLVAGGIVVVALALWKIRIVIALLLLGFTIAAAMRSSVDWLGRHARVPRPVGVLVHYAVFVGVLVLVLWIFVPRAIDQVQQA